MPIIIDNLVKKDKNKLYIYKKRREKKTETHGNHVQLPKATF